MANWTDLVSFWIKPWLDEATTKSKEKISSPNFNILSYFHPFTLLVAVFLVDVIPPKSPFWSSPYTCLIHYSTFFWPSLFFFVFCSSHRFMYVYNLIIKWRAIQDLVNMSKNMLKIYKHKKYRLRHSRYIIKRLGMNN